MQKKKLDSSKIKILVCCHKPCELPKDAIFLPIQVGAAISDVDLGMQRDDQVNGEPCDNISTKNKSYCELTAMYWAWKNIKKLYPDLEYIGLNHYRRYFSFGKKCLYRHIFIKETAGIQKYKIKNELLKKVLKENSVIIAKKKKYPYPLYVDYSVCHLSEDLRLLRIVIADLYPNYLSAFDSVLMRGSALAPYNMTVIGWNHYDKYCSWLFPILTEVEKRIDISKYNDVQKRIFGYMAERLFNVWLLNNKMDFIQIPVVQFVDNEKNHSSLWFFIWNFLCSISSSIVNCVYRHSTFFKS